MAVSLAQAKLDTQDDIQAGVIDEFRKSSFVLDAMTFDDAVSPGTNQATLTYGYTRLITQPTAAFRAINAEYTTQEVTKERKTVELKVFGGNFAIDRVLARTGGLVDEVNLQITQKVKATRALFHDAFINGDSGTTAAEFDGIDQALVSSSTEYTPAGTTKYIDISTGSNMDSNYKDFLDMLDEWLALLDGRPDAILGNSKSILRLKQMARRAGYATKSEDAFGRSVDGYDGIPLVDLGEKPGSTNPIIPIETRDPDGAGSGGNITGLTDLYAVRFGLDGVHGVSLANTPLVQTWLPDFSAAGAVHNGEVEMVAAVAIKATKAAAVFRNIKVS